MNDRQIPKEARNKNFNRNRFRFNDLNASLRIACVLLGLLSASALLGLIWTPYDPNALNFSAQLAPPSLAHPFGTDHLGRDLFSRMLRATPTMLLIGLIAVGIGTSLGLLLGASAGWFGGWLDELITRLLDAMAAFPTILLALLLAAVLGPGITSAMLAVGFSNVPGFARLTRAGVLKTKHLEFIDGARALGASPTRLLFRHVLPNIAGNLIVQATLAFAIAILAEAALSYLGLGVQPPAPSWGRMLREAQTFIELSAWPTIFPGLAIVFSVFSLNLFGDGLRDTLDPQKPPNRTKTR